MIMEPDPNKELIEHLANEWALIELPGPRPLYVDCMRVVGGLLAVTQSRERTEYLFMGILQQAIQLGKTYFWVEREVRFELLACEMNRSELARLHLRHSEPISDLSLDTYNERVNRFPSGPQPEEYD
ncbi:hypothetical protein GCM10027085_52920 [Spirosoma aerophilum]